MPICESDVKESTHSYFLKNSANYFPKDRTNSVSVCPFPATLIQLYVISLLKLTS